MRTGAARGAAAVRPAERRGGGRARLGRLLSCAARAVRLGGRGGYGLRERACSARRVSAQLGVKRMWVVLNRRSCKSLGFPEVWFAGHRLTPTLLNNNTAARRCWPRTGPRAAGRATRRRTRTASTRTGACCPTRPSTAPRSPPRRPSWRAALPWPYFNPVPGTRLYLALLLARGPGPRPPAPAAARACGRPAMQPGRLRRPRRARPPQRAPPSPRAASARSAAGADLPSATPRAGEAAGAHAGASRAAQPAAGAAGGRGRGHGRQRVAPGCARALFHVPTARPVPVLSWTGARHEGGRGRRRWRVAPGRAPARRLPCPRVFTPSAVALLGEFAYLPVPRRAHGAFLSGSARALPRRRLPGSIGDPLRAGLAAARRTAQGLGQGMRDARRPLH